MTANPRSMRGCRSIYLVKPLVPSDKAREPDLDRGFRLEAKIAARRFDLGKTYRNIARLQRQQFFHCGAAEQLLKNSNEIEELLGTVITQVVKPVGNPVRPCRRRAIMSRQRARDDVVDISEVTGHLALVKDFDRLTRQNRPREQIGRHVRPAP